MTQSNNSAPVSAQSVPSKKKEKAYGQKTVKFYASVDQHTERVLWYISHLHKRVWNNMFAVCSADFSLVDTFIDKVNPKGQEEIAKIKESVTIVAGQRGDYVKSKTLSEFGMLYCLGPMRNADPELLQLPVNDLQKPCRVLAKSWKSFFELSKRGDKEARPPRMKNDLFFFTLQWEKPRVANERGSTCLFVNHNIDGAGKVFLPMPPYVSALLADKKLRYVTVKRTYPFYDRRSKFEVNIVYETSLAEQCPITENTRYAGVDIGSRRITLVCEAGNVVKTWHLPKWDQYFTKQRQSIEERMGTKTKGSRAWMALYDARTKLSKKWADKQKDLQRKIAREMVGYADLFFVGETAVRLGLARSEGTKGQHRAVQNTGNLSRFIRFLKEKAAECGKRVVEVPDFVSDGDKRIRKVESALRHLEYGMAHKLGKLH